MFRLFLNAGVALLFAFLALLAAGTAAPAHAERLERTQHSITVRVDRAGLLNGNADAVRDAHGAILRAARRVCGLAGGARLRLRERLDGEECVREAVEQTVAMLRSPSLANAFAGLLGEERVARLEWGTPQIVAFAAALPTRGDSAAT